MKLIDSPHTHIDMPTFKHVFYWPGRILEILLIIVTCWICMRFLDDLAVGSYTKLVPLLYLVQQRSYFEFD